MWFVKNVAGKSDTLAYRILRFCTVYCAVNIHHKQANYTFYKLIF
jgi:hypothetical protein